MTSKDFNNSRITSRLGRDSVASPTMVANQELQEMLNQGYMISDNRVSKADVTDAFHRSLDSFNKQQNGGREVHRMVGDVNIVLPPGFGLKQPSL